MHSYKFVHWWFAKIYFIDISRSSSLEETIIFSNVAFHGIISKSNSNIYLFNIYNIIQNNSCKMWANYLLCKIWKMQLKVNCRGFCMKLWPRDLRSLVVILLLDAFHYVRSFAKRSRVSNVSQFYAALFLCCCNVVKRPSRANIESRVS